MNLNLEVPQVDLILQALQVQPYQLVAPLIQEILTQMNNQPKDEAPK